MLLQSGTGTSGLPRALLGMPSRSWSLLQMPGQHMRPALELRVRDRLSINFGAEQLLPATAGHAESCAQPLKVWSA